MVSFPSPSSSVETVNILRAPEALFCSIGLPWFSLLSSSLKKPTITHSHWEHSSMDIRSWWVGVEHRWKLAQLTVCYVVFVGIGLIRLRKRMIALEGEKWKPVYLANKYFMYLVGGTFAALNALTIFMTARPHKPGTIPRFYWPIAIAADAVVGVVYWMALKALQTKFGAKIGFHVTIHEAGDVDVPENPRNMMDEAKSRIRVSYKASLVRPRTGTNSA